MLHIDHVAEYVIPLSDDWLKMVFQVVGFILVFMVADCENCRFMVLLPGVKISLVLVIMFNLTYSIKSRSKPNSTSPNIPKCHTANFRANRQHAKWLPRYQMGHRG